MAKYPPRQQGAPHRHQVKEQNHPRDLAAQKTLGVERDAERRQKACTQQRTATSNDSLPP
jgi:hypothetical protein